jgi:flagellar capping protein FliD
VNRSRSLVSLVLPAALVLTPVLASTQASASTSTSSILTATKAALAGQHSVHLAVSIVQGSNTTVEEVDLGTTTGVESIASGNAKATVEVAPMYGYMTGDPSGLTSLIGLTASEAKKLGTKWMSLKAGTTPYADLKTAATLPFISGLLPDPKGTTSSTETVGNVKLYVLKWSSAATSSSPKLTDVLAISMGKTPLPVKETETDASASETTEFSRWGESVVVHVPPAATTVPYSSIVS